MFPLLSLTAVVPAAIATNSPDKYLGSFLETANISPLTFFTITTPNVVNISPPKTIL